MSIFHMKFQDLSQLVMVSYLLVDATQGLEAQDYSTP